jgi:hypothetical protein
VPTRVQAWLCPGLRARLHGALSFSVCGAISKQEVGRSFEQMPQMHADFRHIGGRFGAIVRRRH